MLKKIIAGSLLLVFVFTLALSVAITEVAYAKDHRCQCAITYCINPPGQVAIWGETNPSTGVCEYTGCPIGGCD